MKLEKIPTLVKAAAATLLLLVLAACGATATETPAPAPAQPTMAPTVATAPTAIPSVTADSTEAPDPTVAARPTRSPPLGLSAALAPLSLDIEGEGNQEIDQFIVAKGVMILMANHDGDGKFKVTISNPEGDMEPTVDTVGPYFGNRLYTAFRGNTEGMTTGGHTIKVEAEGPWRLQLFQDYPGSGQDPTIQFGGVGDGGGGWMQLDEGEFTILAAHDGESHFQVRLHDSRGTPELLVIDAEGPFDETVPITVSEDPAVSNIAPGVYGIGVQGDGIWSLIVEDPNNPDN